jgi:YD repeat-containing protein
MTRGGGGSACDPLSDAEARLTQVTEGGQTVASMTYDFSNCRTSLTTPAGTTYFHSRCC